MYLTVTLGVYKMFIILGVLAVGTLTILLINSFKKVLAITKPIIVYPDDIIEFVDEE